MNQTSDRTSRHASVLVVDDDQGTRDTFAWALRREGFIVDAAASGEQGLARARSFRFDLLLVDLRLPDMLGTAMVRTLAREERLRPFLLMSGFLNTQSTVEAVKLGAIDVLEKPIDVDALVSVARSAVCTPGPTDLSLQSSGVVPSGCVAGRWATNALKACESPSDLKTLEDWARFVGVSHTSLCETCRLVGIPPHDARDFVRVLRALRRSLADSCPPEVFLDVSDRRTLDRLFKRAGLARRADAVSLEEFLRLQAFIPGENLALRTFRALLLDPHQ